MQTIFHVDELEKWGLALGNAENMLAYCEESGEAVKIELLANGIAVRALAAEGSDAALLQRTAALAEKGVVFAACRNALRAQQIEPEALAPFAVTVPAGVVELAQKQQAGYAYIRP